MWTSEAIYPLVLLASAGLSLAAPLLGWLRGRGARSTAMALVAMGTATITIGAAFTFTAEEIGQALFWARIENIGYAMLVPSWLIFSQRYINVPERLMRWLNPALAVYALVTVGAAIGPPSALTWSNPRFEPVGGGHLFMIDRGPVIWAAFLFTVGLALVVMALFFRASSQVNRYYRWKIRLVPLAMLVPFYAGLHDSLFWQPLPQIRFVPLAFAFFSLVLYFAVVRQRLGDLVPIARDLILENLYEAVFVLDSEGRIVDLNSVGARLAGGESEDDVMGVRLGDVLPELDRQLNETDSGQPGEIEVNLQTPAGDRIYEGRVSPVLGPDEGYFGRVVVLQDVTERKAAEARMRHMALHDELTGLPNRPALLKKIEEALERARRHEVFELALLFIDIDRFKVINDSLGHAAGDQLLVKIAERLGSAARQLDTVARMGGDEFVVLLEGVRGEDAARKAGERLLDCFQEPFEVAGHELQISASIGLTYQQDLLGTSDAYLRSADLAMYRAKSLGGDRMIVYERRLDSERAQLERNVFERREGE